MHLKKSVPTLLILILAGIVFTYLFDQTVIERNYSLVNLEPEDATDEVSEDLQAE